MKIKIYNSLGSDYNPVLEIKRDWVPREGETLVLKGRIWIVSSVLNDFDKNYVVVYVKNNKGEVLEWINEHDRIKVK